MKQPPVYLDYAAATPVDRRVVAAMAPYLTSRFYNPSALYTPARQVQAELEKARADVAEVLGCRAGEVWFCAGSTESVNLAIQGVLAANPGEAVISTIEHASVKAAARKAASKVLECPVQPTGLVDLERLAALINDQTVLLSIGYVNNEIGVIQPLAKIAKLVKSVRVGRELRGIKLPLYLHSDAAQAAELLSLAVNSLGVDLLSLNGAKIYAPKQSGCLYVRHDTSVAPLIVGGGQEGGLRGGTENVAVAVGFATALKLAAARRRRELPRLVKLRASFVKQLAAALPEVSLNGAPSSAVPSIVSFSWPGKSGERLVHQLEQAGFLVATGAACSANADKPSEVLLALGLKSDVVNASLRVSLGRTTTPAQLRLLVEALKHFI